MPRRSRAHCAERTARKEFAEQDRFRANEPGHVLDVRIDAPGDTPVVERVHTGKYRCKDWTPEIAVSSNVERLREQLRALDENDAFLQDAAHAAMRDADTQTIGGGGGSIASKNSVVSS